MLIFLPRSHFTADKGFGCSQVVAVDAESDWTRTSLVLEIQAIDLKEPFITQSQEMPLSSAAVASCRCDDKSRDLAEAGSDVCQSLVSVLEVVSTARLLLDSDVAVLHKCCNDGTRENCSSWCSRVIAWPLSVITKLPGTVTQSYSYSNSVDRYLDPRGCRRLQLRLRCWMNEWMHFSSFLTGPQWAGVVPSVCRIRQKQE